MREEDFLLHAFVFSISGGYMNYIFNAEFINICYSFAYDQTKLYFEKYIVPIRKSAVDISLSKYEIDSNPYGFEYLDNDSYQEFRCLMVKTGNYLLSHNSCMFHGALIQWKDIGILFTAPSGTGKTSQYYLWKELETESVRIINGDKPILEYDGKEIISHSSPWNGKEQLGEPGMSVPLKAIILLEQGDCNEIKLLSPSDAVVPLFEQFIAYPENTDIIKQEACFLDAMLDSVPVWKLTNKGDIESAILTRDTLEAYYGL